MLHESGVRSHAVATKCNRNVEKELRAYGDAGSYIGRSTDGQTAAIFAGKRPVTEGDAWGYLPHDHARSRAYRDENPMTRGAPDARASTADLINPCRSIATSYRDRRSSPMAASSDVPPDA